MAAFPNPFVVAADLVRARLLAEPADAADAAGVVAHVAHAAGVVAHAADDAAGVAAPIADPFDDPGAILTVYAAILLCFLAARSALLVGRLAARALGLVAPRLSAPRLSAPRPSARIGVDEMNFAATNPLYDELG